MTRTLISLAGLTVAALALASCGQQADPAPVGPAVTAKARVHAVTAGSAAGAGVITAIDPGAGTVTISHEPIKALNWPAMTMSFRTGPAVLREAAVGDRIQFDLTVRGGAGEVTAIYPR